MPLSKPSLSRLPGASPRGLADLQFFAGASTSTLDRLAERVRWIELQPGQLLLDMGEDGRDPYIIVRGTVRVMLRTSSGQEMILGDVDAEAVIGEQSALDGEASGANVTALSRTVACRIPRQAFLETLALEPVIALRVMRNLSARLRLANKKLFESAVLSARARLTSELLRLARPASRPGWLVVSPPPLQSDLAARIGVRREAVSREMKHLEKAGLIQREKGGLYIPNAQRLDWERTI